MYVIRQHACVFLVFLAAGVLFCVLPWCVDTISPLWGRLLFTGLGGLLLGVAILGWRSLRIGLVVDRRGLWLSGYSLTGRVLMPWDDIIAARFVTWDSPEGEREGVLLQVSQEADPPGGKDFQSITKPEIEELLGPIDAPNALLLEHDEWAWEPQKLADVINRYIDNPEERCDLDVYANT